ncbi:MAG: family N-acetyltransferase [Frankiales bacterium]|nr:family N-acetyltransferase [Frankiales bacterium]
MAARQATPVDAVAVGRTLGRAFADDPVWRWLVGGRAERVVAAITQHGVERHAEQFTVVDDAAAAWWHPPGHWRLGLADTLRLLPRVAPMARLGSLRLLRMSSLVERQHPPGDHAYLGYLGAAVQGQGFGAQVLGPALEVCDAFGWPAFLESSNPRNLPFYRRHGFVDREPLTVPRGCPGITPMWRDPR